MNKIKLEFQNSNGETLAGLLELPERAGEIESFALFAHCFTCGKDIAAASRFNRRLSEADFFCVNRLLTRSSLRGNLRKSTGVPLFES